MSSSNPVLRIGDVLVVSMHDELDDRSVRELRENLGRTLSSSIVRGLVLELSGVDASDANVVRGVRDVWQIARFLGVETILVGLDPALADALVAKGVSFEGVVTASDRKGALAKLARRVDRRTLNRAFTPDS